MLVVDSWCVAVTPRYSVTSACGRLSGLRCRGDMGPSVVRTKTAHFAIPPFHVMAPFPAIGAGKGLPECGRGGCLGFNVIRKHRENPLWCGALGGCCGVGGGMKLTTTSSINMLKGVGLREDPCGTAY